MGDASGSRGIDPADVRSALEDILQSETFARSERSRELLKYIVERDLEGASDRLKGFAIALDVFNREDNFDPSTDAVVRVQAGRLRDLLETYYLGEGAGAAVRITIPRGTYVPLYDTMAQPPPAAEAAAAPGPAPPESPAEHPPPAGMAAAVRGDLERMFMVNRRLFWIAAATVIAMLAGIIALMVDNSVAERTRLADEAALLHARRLTASAALPSITILPETDAALRRALEDAIPRFGSVVYRYDRSVTLGHPLADFYIHTSKVGKNSLNVQFFHRESGILVGSDQMSAAASGSELDDDIARILSRFLPVNGTIYAFLKSNGRLNPLTACLMLSSAYFTDHSAERQRNAYDCHEKLLDEGIQSPLSYADLASLSVGSVTERYDYPKGATLDDAVRLARRAVELAPQSARVHQALAWALQVSGEQSAALQEIRRAYAFNPYDLGIAASYGNTLVAVGDFPAAVKVLEHAADVVPVHPTWWDYALFIAAFQTGRQDLVSESARNLAGRERPHYCAARLIAAHMEGDEKLRAKMLAEITSHDGPFARDPMAYYAQVMPRDAAEKMVAALGEAGLKFPVAHDG